MTKGLIGQGDPPTTELESGCDYFVRAAIAASAAIPTASRANLVQLRRELELCREKWRAGGPGMASTLEDSVPMAGHAAVRTRLYRPAGLAQNAPLLIYLHGGGWTLFSIDTHDRVMREYAARAGCLVLGVDYSLSPEHRFPLALEQTLAVVEWVFSLPGILGDVGPVFLGGDSAGGNLALAAALKLRDEGSDCQLAGLLLNYPVTSSEISARASREFGGAGNMLTTTEMLEFWENYIPEPGDRKHPYASPARADLRRLPPSLFVIARCDVLAEQGIAFAQAYRDAGNAATLRIYDGAPHSFLEAVSVSPLAERALQESSDWLSREAREAHAETSAKQGGTR